MRALAIAILFVASSTGAHAEPTDWAGFKLGSKPKKVKPVSATLYGCAGSVSVNLDKKKKVTSVVFDIDMDSPCMSDGDPDALAQKLSDAISADMSGVKPTPNGQGDTLWEGKTASVILTTGGSGDSPIPEMWLVPADTSGARTCWGNDGFAEFYAAFTKAVAGGGDVTPYFQLPFDDQTGELGKIKKAKQLKKLLTDDTKDQLADPNTKGYCSIANGTYLVDIPDPHGDLIAVHGKAGWKFASLQRIEME